MSQIQVSDLDPWTYVRYQQAIDEIYIQLINISKSLNKNYEAIVPILRSGAMLAVPLSSKLNIVNFLPVQYKYEGKNIKKLLTIPQLSVKIPKNPLFLITDDNTVFGKTVYLVAKDLKNQYPSSTVVFASIVMDYSLYQTKMDNIDYVVCGSFSNESRLLDVNRMKKLNVTDKLVLFPWQNAEEELREINS